MLALRTTNFWTFTGPDDLLPWGDQSGPPYQGAPQGISNSRIAAGQWAFTANGNSDMSRFEFEADTRNYSNISIRMKTSQDAFVSVYWGAVDSPGPSALRKISFTAKAGSIRRIH